MLTRPRRDMHCSWPSFGAGAAVPPSAPVHGVVLQKVWIPMKDGVRLAATLYMPDPRKAGEHFSGAARVFTLPEGRR